MEDRIFSAGIKYCTHAAQSEVITLGTIAVHAGDILMNPLQRKLQKIVWKEAYESCVIMPTSLGASIGSLGLIAIVLDELQ